MNFYLKFLVILHKMLACLSHSIRVCINACARALEHDEIRFKNTLAHFSAMSYNYFIPFPSFHSCVFFFSQFVCGKIVDKMPFSDTNSTGNVFHNSSTESSFCFVHIVHNMHKKDAESKGKKMKSENYYIL